MGDSDDDDGNSYEKKNYTEDNSVSVEIYNTLCEQYKQLNKVVSQKYTSWTDFSFFHLTGAKVGVIFFFIYQK